LDPFQASEYASISISIAIFAFAAWSDLKTREVSDKVWFVYGPLGLAFTIYRLWVEPSLLLLTGASIGLSILVAFGLVFFGLTGGADALALICLSLTLPVPPRALTPMLGYFLPFFPIVVLYTGYLASILVPFVMIAKNLSVWVRLKSGMFNGLEHESTWKKALAFITGFPTSLSQLRSTFYLYPMEKVVEDKEGVRRTLDVYSSADVDRDQVVSEFEESLKRAGSPGTVWVTPGLPLLVFLLIALVFVLTLGDPLFFAISVLMRH